MAEAAGRATRLRSRGCGRLLPMDDRPTREPGALELEFLLDNFEHLVETPRGHIVRITGRWRGPTAGATLPHPSLLVDEPADDPLMVPPLPLPGNAPPYVDGTTAWSSSYSIPRDRFLGSRGPACRLQAAPGVVYPLAELTVPDRPAEAKMRRPAGNAATRSATGAGASAREAEAPPPEPPAPPPASFTELILPAMRGRRRLVAAVVALALLSASAGMVLREPEYRGVATLVVTPLPRQDVTLAELPDVRFSRDPASVAQTSIELVRAPGVVDETARRLGPPWTAKELRRVLELDPVSGSDTFTVTAVDDDGPTAARVANTFAETAVRTRDERLRSLANESLADAEQQLEAVDDPASAQAQALQLRISALRQILNSRNATLSITRSAAVPADPAGLPPWAVLLLTTLAGLVLGGGAAALLDLVVSRRVDAPGDATAIYPLPVLTRVPAVRRRRLRRRGAEAGVALAPELREAFRTVQLELDLASGVHEAVLFTSASNGDGKTTSAVSFALAAAESGRDVVLVDLDLRKPDVAVRLGITPERGIGDVLDGRTPVEDVLVPVPGAPRLRVLAPVEPMSPRGIGEVARQLEGIVDEVSRSAEFVVIDTPPVAEVSDALTFAAAADDVLLVCRLGRTAQTQLETARDLLERTRARPAGFVLVG